MSMIADALRKAESASPSTPTPPSPHSLWVYRAILVGCVAIVLAGLGAVTRQRAPSPAQNTPAATPAPAPIAQKSSGLKLLRTAQGGLNLSGIVRGGSGKPLALINDELVEEGGTVRGAKLVRVDQETVELEQDGRTRTLTLPE